MSLHNSELDSIRTPFSIVGPITVVVDDVDNDVILKKNNHFKTLLSETEVIIIIELIIISSYNVYIFFKEEI